MTKINKNKYSLCQRGCTVRQTLIHGEWEYKFAQSLWKCVFSNEGQKGSDVDPDEKRGEEEPERVGEGETMIRMHCIKKSIFNKRKKRMLHFMERRIVL